MLELAERLAELHAKRTAIHERRKSAEILMDVMPEMRAKYKIYKAASKVLLAEITRIENLIEQGL